MTWREFNKKHMWIGGLGNVLAGFAVFIVAFLIFNSVPGAVILGLITWGLIEDSVL